LGWEWCQCLMWLNSGLIGVCISPVIPLFKNLTLIFFFVLGWHILIYVFYFLQIWQKLAVFIQFKKKTMNRMTEEDLLMEKALNKVREEDLLCMLSSNYNGTLLSQCPSGYCWWCGITDWVIKSGPDKVHIWT